MADLTMCMPAKCQSKQWCYRHCAHADLMQQYADFSTEPRGQMGECAYFIPMMPNQPEAA